MWVFDPFSGQFRFTPVIETEGTLTANGSLDFGAMGDITIDMGLRVNDGSIIDSGDRLV